MTNKFTAEQFERQAEVIERVRAVCAEAKAAERRRNNEGEIR